MSQLILIRHGRTDWNVEGRLTGRTDISVNEEGRAQLSAVTLPPLFDDAVWHVSPLKRTHETAALLGIDNFHIEPRLIEMDFGRFEGRTLSDLRNDPEIDMQALEDKGLHFQPPDGESPYMVQQRLRPFLQTLAGDDRTHVAVCHKSVIRSIMALAYDWPMLGKPPVKLVSLAYHIFSLNPDGAPEVVAMNQKFPQKGDPITSIEK